MKKWLRIRSVAFFAVLLIAGYAVAQNGYPDQYPDQGQYPGQYQDQGQYPDQSQYPGQYQDQGQYPDQAQHLDGDTSIDPPTRVASLQYIQGEISLQPAGVEDWVDASLNRPLTTDDRLWVDRDSRAELSIGSAALRLDGETSMQFLNLSDETAQIELDQGTMNLFVRSLDEGEVVEVDTPNLAFTVTRPGEYRFDVWPERDESSVQVRRGEGEASGQDTAMVVYEGERYLFRDGQSLRYRVEELRRPDGFDRWSEDREQEALSSPSVQYVAPGTIGYAAMDGYGDWEPMPVYGTVWFPHVYAGWAPYRDGHWAWIAPWGWTWVDNEPWGFTPFHYGRWAFVGGRWGWIPGPVTVRPVYAPALVAWIGGTPGFGVSIGVGIGGVGWVPLGWRDPYIPCYHVSRRYAREVNIANSREVNIRVINNYYGTTNVRFREREIRRVRYENAHVRGAVTAVSGKAFVSGRGMSRVAVTVPSRDVTRFGFGVQARVVPTREAVLGGGRTFHAPKNWVAPRRVVARRPPPPPPVRFEQQRPMLEKSRGVPLLPAQRELLRSSEPTQRRFTRPSIVRATPGRPSRRPTQVAPGAFPGARPSLPTPPSQWQRPERAPRLPQQRPGTSPTEPRRGWPTQAAPEGRPQRGREAAPSERPAAPPSQPPAPQWRRPEQPRRLPEQPSVMPPASHERPQSPVQVWPGRRPEGRQAAPHARPEPPARRMVPQQQRREAAPRTEPRVEVPRREARPPAARPPEARPKPEARPPEVRPKVEKRNERPAPEERGRSERFRER